MHNKTATILLTNLSIRDIIRCNKTRDYTKRTRRKGTMKENMEMKNNATELTRADFGIIGKRILDGAMMIAGKDAKTTFEKFIKNIQDNISHDRTLLLYETGEWYYLGDSPDGIGTPDPMKMLSRYIELSQHNGKASVADIKAKADDIRELMAGYIREASMLYLEEMRNVGVGIEWDAEISEKKLAETIHGFFSVTSDELLEGNVEDYEIEELSNEIWNHEEWNV